MRLIELENDAFEALEPHDFLQSGLWARHKQAFGWKPWRFCMETSSGTMPLLVLTRRVLGQWHLAYVTHGPSRAAMDALLADYTCEGEGRVLRMLGRQIRQSINLRLLAVRFEPAWVPRGDLHAVEEISAMLASGAQEESQDSTESPLGAREGKTQDARSRFLAWRTHCFKPHLVKPSADIQPPDTVLLDLGPEPPVLLAAMRAKTRYNIRLAAKKGVEISVEGVESLGIWYGLYQETALRDRISIHSKAYYESLLATNLGTVELHMARHEGDVLAGIIVLYQGRTATYVYGASANIKRNLMASYLLQWHAIQRARDRQCSVYDFFGLPPWADQDHPMYGLYQFKTGFGGSIVHYPGAWDIGINRLVHFTFRCIEGLRLWYFRVLKKRV